MYPSWRYHPTKAPKLIHSADQEPGAAWADSPAKFGLAPDVPAGAPLGTSTRMRFMAAESDDEPDASQIEAREDALSVPDPETAKAIVAKRKGKAKA